MPRAFSWRSTIRSRVWEGSAMVGLLSLRSGLRINSGVDDRPFDLGRRRAGEVLRQLADDLRLKLGLHVLAQLAEDLGLGGDHQLVNLPLGGALVEPVGGR